MNELKPFFPAEIAGLIAQYMAKNWEDRVIAALTDDPILVDTSEFFICIRRPKAFSSWSRRMTYEECNVMPFPVEITLGVDEIVAILYGDRTGSFPGARPSASKKIVELIAAAVLKATM